MFVFWWSLHSHLKVSFSFHVCGNVNSFLSCMCACFHCDVEMECLQIWEWRQINPWTRKNDSREIASVSSRVPEEDWIRTRLHNCNALSLCLSLSLSQLQNIVYTPKSLFPSELMCTIYRGMLWSSWESRLSFSLIIDIAFRDHL